MIICCRPLPHIQKLQSGRAVAEGSTKGDPVSGAGAAAGNEPLGGTGHEYVHDQLLRPRYVAAQHKKSIGLGSLGNAPVKRFQLILGHMGRDA